MRGGDDDKPVLYLLWTLLFHGTPGSRGAQKWKALESEQVSATDHTVCLFWKCQVKDVAQVICPGSGYK